MSKKYLSGMQNRICPYISIQYRTIEKKSQFNSSSAYKVQSKNIAYSSLDLGSVISDITQLLSRLPQRGCYMENICFQFMIENSHFLAHNVVGMFLKKSQKHLRLQQFNQRRDQDQSLEDNIRRQESSPTAKRNCRMFPR